jgi:hypothetical protein
VIEKSGDGFGGGCTFAAEPAPLPHPVLTAVTSNQMPIRTCFRDRLNCHDPAVTGARYWNSKPSTYIVKIINQTILSACRQCRQKPQGYEDFALRYRGRYREFGVTGKGKIGGTKTKRRGLDARAAWEVLRVGKV